MNVRWWIAAGLLLFSGAAAQDREETETRTADEEERERPRVEEPEYVEVNLSGIPGSSAVTTRLPVDFLLTPANVGTVTRALIEEQDDVMLSGALRNVSGVNVQTQSLVHDYFLIRGFDSLSSGLIMTDGVAEPEATFYNTYNIEAVEVLKGPAGFLYGSGLNNPLGGTVNMVRKQPLPSTFGRLFASLGSFDSKRVLVDWNLSSAGGGFAFRINTLWMETGGYRDDLDGEQLAINPSFAWRWGERTTLVLNLEHARSDFVPDAGLPIVNGELPEVPRETNYGSPLDASDQEINRVQIDFEHSFSEAVKLRNKTSYRGLDWQSNGTLILGTADLGGGELAFRSMTLLDNTQEFFDNQLEAVFEASTGSIGHKILAGFEVARLQNDFTLGVAMLPPVLVDDPMDPTTSVMPFPFDAGEATIDTVAPYVVEHMEVSKKFQLLLGARWNQFDFEDKISGVESSDSDVNPWLGVVVAPTETLSVYGNVGSSSFPVDPRTVSGPGGGPVELQPEKGEQWELGLKKKFLDGRMHSTIAVYDIERTNVPIPDANGFTQQAGNQRSRGVEFDLSAEPLPGLRTFVSYAYNDSELTEFRRAELSGIVDYSGNRPAFTPKSLLNFWVSKSFTNGLGVGGGIRFVGEQFIDANNEFVLDGYQVVDATVFYNFSLYRLSLNLKNLLDEEYGVRGFGTSAVTPGAPFGAFVAFEFKR